MSSDDTKQLPLNLPYSETKQNNVEVVNNKNNDPAKTEPGTVLDITEHLSQNKKRENVRLYQSILSRISHLE